MSPTNVRCFSLPVSPTSQSDSWGLLRPHSETFGRGNILLFKSFCAMTLNASGLSRGRDTPYTRTPKAVCVLACVLCWLNANNVEHMNLRLKHVRNYEKLRLGPTPFSALYICYLCVCLCLYIIYFDKFIWQLVNEMPGRLTRRPQYFRWCGSFINIFDVITHVSDIWQCPTKVWHPIPCVGEVLKKLGSHARS